MIFLGMFKNLLLENKLIPKIMIEENKECWKEVSKEFKILILSISKMRSIVSTKIILKLILNWRKYKINKCRLGKRQDPEL